MPTCGGCDKKLPLHLIKKDIELRSAMRVSLKARIEDVSSSNIELAFWDKLFGKKKKKSPSKDNEIKEGLEVEEEVEEGPTSPQEFEKLHPRDDEGRFRKKVGEEDESLSPISEVPVSELPEKAKQVVTEILDVPVDGVYSLERDGKSYLLYDTIPGGTDLDKGKLLSYLADISADYPTVSQTSIVIMDMSVKSEYENTGAFVIGSGGGRDFPYIFVNENGFKDVSNVKEPGWFMKPFYKDPYKYLVAHEFGHRVDNDITGWTHGDNDSLWEHAGGLSKYGKENSTEGYAEAFADWTVSNYKPRNVTTISYALNEGWSGSDRIFKGGGR